MAEVGCPGNTKWIIVDHLFILRLDHLQEWKKPVSKNIHNTGSGVTLPSLSSEFMVIEDCQNIVSLYKIHLKKQADGQSLHADYNAHVLSYILPLNTIHTHQSILSSDI